MTTELRHCIICDHAMTSKTVEEVEVDYCPACHGLWLDKDEIRRLSLKPAAALGELRSLVDDGGPVEPPPRNERPCPACGGKLTLALLGGVCLRHCMVCDGVFLERGELVKAMEAIQAKGDEAVTVVALAKSVVARGSIGS